MNYVEATNGIGPPSYFSAPRNNDEYELQSVHGKLLKSIIEFRGCKTIVEIGVSCGVTTHQLCEGAKKSSGHVFGFDIWDTHGLWNQIPAFACKEFVEEMLRRVECDKYCTLTKINTHTTGFPEILKNMCPKIDFAFIDACHSYTGVMHDFNAVYPLLTDDGIIAFHDTGMIDGSREVMLDLRTKLNDGTYDVMDMFSCRDSCGLSLLTKRTLYNRERPFDNICGSISSAEEIVKREQEWYRSQLS